MAVQTSILGAWGEEKVSDYLSVCKFSIIERNYRTRYGEIDIIATEDKFLVFIEVKLRKNRQFAAAREAVTPRKQQKILQTAQIWMQENPVTLQPRFDVIEVYAPKGQETKFPQFHHLRNAFP